MKTSRRLRSENLVSVAGFSFFFCPVFLISLLSCSNAPKESLGSQARGSCAFFGAKMGWPEGCKVLGDE